MLRELKTNEMNMVSGGEEIIVIGQQVQPAGQQSAQWMQYLWDTAQNDFHRQLIASLDAAFMQITAEIGEDLGSQGFTPTVESQECKDARTELEAAQNLLDNNLRAAAETAGEGSLFGAGIHQVVGGTAVINARENVAQHCGS